MSEKLEIPKDLEGEDLIAFLTRTAMKVVAKALPGDQVEKHPGAAKILYDSAVDIATNLIKEHQVKS